MNLKKKVILHVRPAIYRTILGFQINNPLKKQFIKEYTPTFNIVEKASKPFEKIGWSQVVRRGDCVSFYDSSWVDVSN